MKHQNEQVSVRDLLVRVERQAAEVAELRRLVNLLGSQLASAVSALRGVEAPAPDALFSPPASASPAEPVLSPPDTGSTDAGAAAADATSTSTDRRGFLRAVGAVGAATLGAAAATGLRATPAAAADGQAVLQGTTGATQNVATSMTTLSATGATSGIGVAAFRAVGPVDSNGIIGQSSGPLGAGVYGRSSDGTGYGVYGEASKGYALFAGSNGRIGMSKHVESGPPTDGEYALGDLIRDDGGNSWVCVVAGSPGSWRKLAGPETAGQIHLLATPGRFIFAFQGRRTGSPPGPTSGAFVSQIAGQTQDGVTVPTGALGVFGTLFVAPVTQGGYCTISAGDAVNPELTVSSMVFGNPSGGFETTSFFMSRLSPAGQLRVYTNRSCFVTLDIVGYLR